MISKEGGSTGSRKFVLPPSLVDALTDDPRTWSSAPGLVSVAQVTPSGLELLFRTAQDMRSAVRNGGGGDDRLAGKTLATVFYEASTRTACSFQAAVARLGGRYVHYAGLDEGAEGGDDLTEAVRQIASGTCAGGDACDGNGSGSADTNTSAKSVKADAIVLRHPVRGSVGGVLQSAGIRPIINAGDGTGEHPTQALLDLFTIWDELKLKSAQSQRRRLVVVLLGDLKHGRTVHSLAKLLARAGLDVPVTLRYASPPPLAMPKAVQDEVAQHGSSVTQETYDSLDKTVLEDADVLYVTRVQRERFQNAAEYEEVKGSYIVNRELMKDAPSSTIVMHPLPRVEEISTDFDDDPRAAYFRQMENGMYVRMAILALLMAEE
jgi:aspartate carbamoyltransferase